MRMLLTLIFGVFLLAGCSTGKTAPDENFRTNSDKTAAVSPAPENNIWLKPVSPVVKLNAKQQKYLDESLPSGTREILEKAERFEILAEVRKSDEDDGEGMTFEPNRILKVADEKDKKEVLEAFYSDASREDSPAVCYYPRHLIRAVSQGKTVEVEICFSCSRFIVKSESGKFDGTIVREDRKSEDFFNQIIEKKGVELKK